MSREFDLTGKRFGNLTVMEFDRYENGQSYWKCRCDCGGEKVVGRVYLQNGHTTSCGCLRGKRGQHNPEAFRYVAVSPEAGEWIKIHYKHTKNDVIKEKFGISDGALHRFARANGLKKSPQFMAKLRKATTDAAYLSHLKHGTWPEKGYRIPRSEEYQFRVGHKETRTPEQIARSAETRKQTIKEDRARIMFGLPQKTKVKLTKQPHKKICQRTYLRKLGYIIERGSDIAYYTPETRRSETFENRKYGDKNYQYFDFRPYDKQE
jgi:hypothetical protein